MPKLDPLLLKMLENGASDLHLQVGQPPKYRVHGEVVSNGGESAALSERQMSEMLFEILTEQRRRRFLDHHDLDFAYGVPGQARFRCNYLFQRTGLAAVFRLIPSRIGTIDELKLPPVLKRIAELRSGLVLVAGPTGSGKSTTLAAIVDHINEHSRRHVLTIEDPVEFVHAEKHSVITHREVGEHTQSFEAALRSLPRHDADVILVGEMRDAETITLALGAAAMGALVYATMPTSSAARTIDRVIDMLPADQQEQARTMLAESLRAIVVQQLVRRRDGTGHIAVNEILLGSAAVSNLIREKKIESLINVIQSGRREGMMAMDDALERLAREGIIDGEDAYMKAMDKRRFEMFLPSDALMGH